MLSCSVNTKTKQATSNESVRVASVSTDVLPFIDRLDLWKHFVGLAYQSYVKNKRYQNNLKAFNVSDLGNEIDAHFEHILQLAPTHFFYTPFTSKHLIDKLKQNNIKCILINHNQMTHPLDYLSIEDTLSVIFNLKKNTSLKKQKTINAYDSLKTLFQNDTLRPLVLSADYYSGYWVCATPQSTVGNLLKDAACSALIEWSNAPTVKLNKEQFFTKAQQANYFRYVFFDTLYSASEVMLKNLPNIERFDFFKDRQVIYANTAESDLFCEALLYPEECLKDVYALTHKSNHSEEKYYKLLAK